MAERVAGTCYIKVDGEQLEISGNVQYPLSKTKKEAIEGINGSPGYKETTIIPYLNVDAILTPDFPREKLVSGSDMTITAEFANGQVYTLMGAYLADEPQADAIEGTVSLSFKGRDKNWSK